MILSKSEIAKYPFTKNAAQYVKDLGLDINDLSSFDFTRTAERAEQRIEEAILEGIVSWKGKSEKGLDYDVETTSFPIAILIVSTIANEFFRRRYALAEANRINNLLIEEKKETLLNILDNSFSWDVRILEVTISQPYDFNMYFVDYLKNSTEFHDYKWKLVNRKIKNGKVFVKKNELARLITEEVKKHIYTRLKNELTLKLPTTLTQRIDRIKQILEERGSKFKRDEIPSIVIEAAYPPCIKRLYNNLILKKHISHIGRFALTSFLLNVGIDVEKLIKLYTSATDFEEGLTRYQVEHIAGKRGSGIKYNPPNCETLKTHNLCPGEDIICKTIRNPIPYYLKKVKKIRTTKPVGGHEKKNS